MTKRTFKFAGIAATAVVTALVLSACGGQTTEAGTDAEGGLTGAVVADGSSTVAPLTEAAADAFRDVEAGINVTVATSGTGGGFAAFCAGETDLSNASRPIKDEEAALCAEAGIEFTEIVMANDGLSVIVPLENDWAECLTVEQLATMWGPASEGTVTSWNQIDASFPDVPLALFGAGTDSGTFDYFTDAINGEEGAIRTDYSPSEDDNITIQGVTGESGGVGFLGLSYVAENADVLRAVAIDGGAGCVEATVETVQDGSYTPLSRPLFVYVKNTSYQENAAVKAFVDYYVENAAAIAEAAIFVPLTDEQIAVAAEELASLAV
ncbi:PstS family phosphate ABC transporter substrate-binding protein [Microcella sp.]|uniref:PstS family phosphate ABC transporter substrate-binding protein n=1 Tax=Microcella sp. TaxID=1913979 RepID=UPI00299F5DF2|nr:PstS family phosphate ABC transporter substrate-binding protein [Microcella sp.]MDX2026024.1 PstS family phosphate ABC transporter substrate-binding protein [Microcella sp.]